MSATLRFNANLMAAASTLKDRRTRPSSAGDSGRRFSSDILAYYENRAIKELILEKYFQYGENFDQVMPECVKTSADLTLDANGVADLPPDAWLFIDLAKSDFSAYIHKIFEDVSAVRAGRVGTIQPSLDDVYFFEEGRKIYVLPDDGATTVKGRYVVTPTDISVIEESGGGNYSVGKGEWTSATGLLAVSMHSDFLITDIGKTVMFQIGTTIYHGRISGYSDTDEVFVSGQGLPTGGEIVEAVMVADSGPDLNDVPIAPIWDPEIVKRMVGYGLADQKNMA
jgi:hypothetical protein